MGASLRYYLVHDDEAFSRVPVARMHALHERRKPWPEHASRRLRVAEIAVEVSGRQVLAILREIFYYLAIGPDGCVAEDFEDDRVHLTAEARFPLSGARDPETPNVIGRGIFEERILRRQYEWTPSSALRRRLHVDLFG